MKMFGNSDADDSKAQAKSKPSMPQVESNTRTDAGNPWISLHGKSHATLPFAMQLMKPLGCCDNCGADWPPKTTGLDTHILDENDDDDDDNLEDERNVHEEYKQIYNAWDATQTSLTPHVVAPMMVNKVFADKKSIALMQEYTYACQIYRREPNSGVMASLRFSLPAMRVAGPFHDADMLALGEILVRYCNGPLSFLRRLDFSRASKEGKYHGICGFRSHGALCLAKILTKTKHVEEVKLQRHRIGPYGASALFLAASKNSVLRKLVLRRCRIGEKGGFAFAEILCPSEESGLQEVDLSANRIGFRGCVAIEQALRQRGSELRAMSVDLEGNLVLQEVMNGVTHGLGVIFALVGGTLLHEKVKDKPAHYAIACGVYSASLLLLYISSTLYHSFFSMQDTKYIFAVLDKCAIYILIAGSYTPFLRIAMSDVTKWSVYLLAFIWLCCFAGIYVEASYPTWEKKKIFSLAMYLGMGWAAIICYPDMSMVLPQPAMHLIILGGVGYTSGVPFFVRNNNLDHSIWHLFVLSGSVMHWLSIYWYVLPFEEEGAVGSCAAS